MARCVLGRGFWWQARYVDISWLNDNKRLSHLTDKNAPPLPDSAKPAGTAFGRTVEDLEKEAMSQHQAKRLAYQRQMRALAEQRTRANGAETSSRGSSRSPSASQSINVTNMTRSPPCFDHAWLVVQIDPRAEGEGE